MLIADRAQDEVEPAEERRVWCGELDDVRLAADGDARSSAPCRSEQAQLADRQIGSLAFVQDAQELATHLAGGANDPDCEAHTRPMSVSSPRTKPTRVGTSRTASATPGR